MIMGQSRLLMPSMDRLHPGNHAVLPVHRHWTHLDPLFELLAPLDLAVVRTTRATT